MLLSSSANFVLHFILHLSQIYSTFPSVVDKRIMCKPGLNLFLGIVTLFLLQE